MKKRCTRCPPDNNMHPLSDFSPSGTTLKSMCKTCVGEYQREYRKRDYEAEKVSKERAANRVFAGLIMNWPAPQ